jgi:hypothetical protein
MYAVCVLSLYKYGNSKRAEMLVDKLSIERWRKRTLGARRRQRAETTFKLYANTACAL